MMSLKAWLSWSWFTHCGLPALWWENGMCVPLFSVGKTVKVSVPTCGKAHWTAPPDSLLPRCDMRVDYSMQFIAQMSVQAECWLIWSFWSQKRGESSHFLFRLPLSPIPHTAWVLPIKPTTKPWQTSRVTPAALGATYHRCSWHCKQVGAEISRQGHWNRTFSPGYLRWGTSLHYLRCTQALRYLKISCNAQTEPGALNSYCGFVLLSVEHRLNW